MGVFVRLFVIGVLCLQESFSDVATHKAGHQINGYSLMNEASNLNVENLMLPSLTTGAVDTNGAMSEKLLHATGERDREAANENTKLSAEANCNRSNYGTVETSLYDNITEELQGWFSYMLVRLCILTFIVSLYFLEMM